MEPLLIIFVAIALLFDFLNGFHDSANVVATVIASRAMSPPVALTLTALTNFIGPFFFGVAVATTIGSEVISEQAVTVPVAMAALISAIIWNLVTWWFGIPSSSSHALIGGFVGAAIAGYSVGVVETGNWQAAEKFLRAVLDRHPNEKHALLWMIDSQLRRSDEAAAVDSVGKFLAGMTSDQDNRTVEKALDDNFMDEDSKGRLARWIAMQAKYPVPVDQSASTRDEGGPVRQRHDL